MKDDRLSYGTAGGNLDELKSTEGGVAVASPIMRYPVFGWGLGPEQHFKAKKGITTKDEARGPGPWHSRPPNRRSMLNIHWCSPFQALLRRVEHKVRAVTVSTEVSWSIIPIRGTLGNMGVGISK